MNRAQRRVVVWLGVVLPLMVAFHGRADPRSHPIPATQVLTATLVVLVLAVLARFIFRRKHRVSVLAPNQRKLVQRLKGGTRLLLALGVSRQRIGGDQQLLNDRAGQSHDFPTEVSCGANAHQV